MNRIDQLKERIRVDCAELITLHEQEIAWAKGLMAANGSPKAIGRKPRTKNPPSESENKGAEEEGAGND